VLNQNWRTELAMVVPDFFARSGRSGCVIECGEGWRWIIDRCAFRIGTALEERETFYFERIREHQGSLRIHWGGRLSAGGEAAVREAIDLAEAASQCFCERCGGPGQLYRCKEVSSPAAPPMRKECRCRSAASSGTCICGRRRSVRARGSSSAVATTRISTASSTSTLPDIDPARPGT
jgi:hypothetical protein